MAASSICSNSSSVLPNACPAGSSSVLPKSAHRTESNCNICRSFAEEKGKNGSNAIAALTGIGVPLGIAKILGDSTIYMASYLIQRRVVFREKA